MLIQADRAFSCLLYDVWLPLRAQCLRSANRNAAPPINPFILRVQCMTGRGTSLSRDLTGNGTGSIYADVECACLQALFRRRDHRNAVLEMRRVGKCSDDNENLS